MTFNLEEADELLSLMDMEDLIPSKDEGDLMAGDVNWSTVRKLMHMKSERNEVWEGVPVPIPGMAMRLRPGHPFEERQRLFQEITESDEDRALRKRKIEESDGAFIRNSWYCSRIGKQVVIVQEADGRITNASYWQSPDRSMERLNLWLSTIGASDGWDWAAERKAKAKLKSMVTPWAYRHYDLTGSFMETSKRSGLTYVFRRLRPTMVLSPRSRRGMDSMRCIAVLCMHPIGYYEQSWGGCMVPTDDVIAHLSFMRGDEARYWGVANNHKASAPEAGI